MQDQLASKRDQHASKRDQHASKLFLGDDKIGAKKFLPLHFGYFLLFANA